MPINESNAKPRAMNWDEQAFISDSSVQKMTSIERWCYRSLLNKAYWCETRPYLPDDDNELWFLAGCENKEQWLAIKKNVIKMFARQKIGKKKILAQKRLVEDWKVFLANLNRMQELGRLGGLARAKLTLSVPQEEVEVIRNIKDIEKEKSETEDSDMSFKNNITDKCRSILGTRIFAGDQGWDEMNSLKRVHGATRVEEVFIEWLLSVEGETISYPLTTFIKIADGLLKGQSDKSNLAKPLILELSYLSDGGVTFNQKQSIEIARLLETYSEADIKFAFKEFIDTLDENSMKYAGKDFSEKAEQIIYTQRKRKQQTEQTTVQLENMITTERQKAEAELANLPKEFDPAIKIEL